MGTARRDSLDITDACDYSRSFMTWNAPYNPNDHRKPGHMPWGNSARIQLDARCELADSKTGDREEFFLITPCRTEWMYRSDTLFQRPNYEYCGVWSRSEFVGLGGAQHRKQGSGVPQYIKDNFTDFRLTTKTFPSTKLLEDDEEIIEATLNDVLLVGRTEIWDDAQGVSAVIEYPIKTMNIHPEWKRFQVDTGPLLFPDLSRTVERRIQCFSIAFVCYNTFDLAEFILRVPISIGDPNSEIQSALEYSDIRRLPAKNTILAGSNA